MTTMEQEKVTAKVILDSISPKGDRIITIEHEEPRIIHCFDDETYILSQIHEEIPIFRLFSEVCTNKYKVAQYNAETECIEFVYPDAYIEQQYTGKMISLTTHQRLNFRVTPEHRMFVGSRKSWGSKKEIIKAKELLGEYTTKRFYKSGYITNMVSFDPALTKLLAYFISDGHLPKKGKQAIFHFKKERKIIEVCRLLSDMGIKYSIRKYTDNVTNIVLTRLDWMQECYDKEGNKVIPARFYNMDMVSFEAFKQGLLESDGCVANNEFNSTSELLIDQLQSLFATHGSSFNKKMYKYSTYTLFKVKFLQEDTPVLSRDKHTVTECEYTGKVYCVTVPTGLILVKRAGIVHISGNCEFLRHRVFSNSVASSRAIPAKTMRKNIRNKMFIPWYWGKEQRGMQAKQEILPVLQVIARWSWIVNAYINLGFSWWYSTLGLHKQLANRNTEYISYIKVLTTSTDYDNFFNLRDNELAQPEIQELAKKMKQAIQESKPQQLRYGEWHTPYVDFFTEEHAKEISVSCCAQTSYRTNDMSIEKANRIVNSLAGSNPKHLSPFEHVCTPTEGEGTGNSKGWIQLRSKIEGK